MATILKYDNVEILRKELVVLKRVSFEIEEGQFVFLIGKVGSGKSSLLKTIYAEIGIENGEARVFDYDLRLCDARISPICAARQESCFRTSSCLPTALSMTICSLCSGQQAGRTRTKSKGA